MESEYPNYLFYECVFDKTHKFKSVHYLRICGLCSHPLYQKSRHEMFLKYLTAPPLLFYMTFLFLLLMFFSDFIINIFIETAIDVAQVFIFWESEETITTQILFSYPLAMSLAFIGTYIIAAFMFSPTITDQYKTVIILDPQDANND